MNELEKILHRTGMSLREACVEAGIVFTEALKTPMLAECSHCGIWNRTLVLKPDLDGSPICPICMAFFGK